MMEQSTQTININDRVKKMGRQKGTAIYTEEENKERARQRAKLYYSLIFEKEGKTTIIIPSNKMLFKMLFKIYLFEFQFKQLTI